MVKFENLLYDCVSDTDSGIMSVVYEWVDGNLIT